MSEQRKMRLPRGWYSGNEYEYQKMTQSWDKKSFQVKKRWKAAMLPHAGWYYSGIFGYEFLRSLNYTPDLVVILGGHMHPSEYPLMWDYNSCQTPFGDLKIHEDCTKEFMNLIPFQRDNDMDNTIEIFLPLIKKELPGVSVVACRIPPSEQWLSYAESFYQILLKHADSPLIIASTDLTHYGRNYQFFPELNGLSPGDWVSQNDYLYINTILQQGGSAQLKCALQHQNACSPGAVAFLTDMMGQPSSFRRNLMRYGTSLENSGIEADSFVGYGSITFI